VAGRISSLAVYRLFGDMVGRHPDDIKVAGDAMAAAVGPIIDCFLVNVRNANFDQAKYAVAEESAVSALARVGEDAITRARK
jgi:hypothetical protein